MKFLLKIIEGPNKGAEIALPEGVAVTFGKDDDCDVVLADATLPDAALTLKAAPDGVTLDGEPLEPLAVAERGATAFAVGPADAPWEKLKWPDENVKGHETPGEGREVDNSSHDSRLTSKEPASAPSAPPREKKKHGGCLGCLIALILLLIALAALVWFFREKARPYAEQVISRFSMDTGEAGLSRKSEDSSASRPSIESSDPLAPLVARCGLAQTNRAGRAVLSGDFATRAERLAATAEAYAVRPGIELDFSDGESLRTAAEDTLALVGERDLRVTAATNRVLVLSGTAVNLKRTLDALSADLPKLRDVDVSGISLAAKNAEIGQETLDERRVSSASRDSRSASKKQEPVLPVCGILTTPYPCLVLKNGARVMEGAPFGDSIVLKIEADSVTLTNATGRFTWKP